MQQEAKTGDRTPGNGPVPAEQAERVEQVDALRDRHEASPWAALAPPLAWWWLMLAGAVALLVGLGTVRLIPYIAKPLGVVVLGVSLAASLAPVAAWLARWLPRRLAVIAVYVILLVGIGAAAWWGLPKLSQEAAALRKSIPDLLNSAEQWLANFLPVDEQAIQQFLTNRLQQGGQLLSTPLSIATSIGDAILGVITLIFISLYGLLEAPKFQRFVLSFVPEYREDHTRTVMKNIASAMGGYLRGVILSGLLVATLTYGGLLLIGMQYAAVLSAISGLFELIPIIGPLIATAVVVVVAFSQSTQTALYALIVMVIVQQIEGNIITPLVMRQQTEVNQLLVLLAVIVGGAIGGVFGILVAIPLTAAIVVVVEEVLAPMVRRWSGAADSST